jgi:hypothetical protein
VQTVVEIWSYCCQHSSQPQPLKKKAIPNPTTNARTGLSYLYLLLPRRISPFLICFSGSHRRKISHHYYILVNSADCVPAWPSRSNEPLESSRPTVRVLFGPAVKFDLILVWRYRVYIVLFLFRECCRWIERLSLVGRDVTWVQE